MSGAYRLVYADARVQKTFIKELKKIPANFRNLILEKLEVLETNPRPQQFKILAQPVFIYGYWAPYRLRVGDWRILYDIDENAKRVVILALRRRGERTYD